MALNARVSWAEDRTFIGRSGSSHSVIMDVDADSGGHDAGVRPLEMLLLGMGGCTAYDVVDILEKGRQPVAGCVVELEAERAEDLPRVFAHHSGALRHLRPRSRSEESGACGEAVDRQVLLGHHHVGQDRGHHPQHRDRRYRRRRCLKPLPC